MIHAFLLITLLLGTSFANVANAANAQTPLTLRNRHISLRTIDVDVHRVSIESRLHLKALSSELRRSADTRELEKVRKEIEELPTIKAQCSEEQVPYNIKMRGSTFVKDDGLFRFDAKNELPCQSLTLRELTIKPLNNPSSATEIRVSINFDGETERHALCELKRTAIAFGLVEEKSLSCSLLSGEGTLLFDLD